MREHYIFAAHLKTLLEGAGWSREKTDGVVDAIEHKRGARQDHGRYFQYCWDGKTTTLRYGYTVGIAQCAPEDTPVLSVGLALAAERLAHERAGRA